MADLGAVMAELATTKDDPSRFSELVFGTPLHAGQRRFAERSTKAVNFLLPGNSWGKVLGNDELVLTPTGWVENQDLKVGDLVIAGDGSPAPVLAVFEQPKMPYWRFVFNDGSSVASGGPHLWKCKGPRQRFVKNHNENGKDYPNEEYGQWVVMSTQDIIDRWGLEPKPKNRIEIPLVEPVQFPERPVELDPYAMGVILGDGSVNPSGGVRVTCHDDDRELLAAFASTHSLGDQDHTVHGLAPTMRHYGLNGHRAWEKFVPQDYLWNSVENRLAVLQGLMDTDGSVSETGGRMEYTTTSPRLRDDVVFLIQSLGGTVTWCARHTHYTYKGERRQGRESYRLNVRSLPMCPFRLERKKSRWGLVERTRTTGRILRRVEPAGERNGRCIQVGHPDETFVTRDFIVTHNTEYIARSVVFEAWHKLSDYTPRSFDEWLKQEYKALVASYTYPVAKESFFRLLSYLEHSEVLDALVKRVIHTDPVKVELQNGAVIDWGSLDGQGRLVEAARRRSIKVDEAGHIPDLSDTFDNILFPRTLGVGGRIDLLGTPKPKSDPYLMEVFEKGKTGKDPFYYAQEGSSLENEFWPEQERERLLANPRYVTGWEECLDCRDGRCDRTGGCSNGMRPLLTPMGRQVILGHFILADGLFFNRINVRRMFTGTYDCEWTGENSMRVSPQEGHVYLGAFDLGGNRRPKKGKRGSDATVGGVIDFTERPWKLVRYEYIPGGDADWEDKYRIMEQMFREYNMPYLLIDATGQVDSVEEALYSRGVDVEGVHFSGAGNAKYDMLRNLQLALDFDWSQVVGREPVQPGESLRGLLRSVPIPRMQGELDRYVLPDDDITQDTVMFLAMLVHHILQQAELPPAMEGAVF